MGGDAVCGGERAEPGVGAGAEESGSGCAADDAGAGASLFLGKTLANFLFVTVVELVLAPVFVMFYNLHALGKAWLLLLVLPLGTWALVVNGIFFAALSIRTRNRELLLPLILFPIFIPALLGDGDVDDVDPDGRRQRGSVDQDAGGLRRDLYDGVHDAVRGDPARRVRAWRTAC